MHYSGGAQSGVLRSCRGSPTSGFRTPTPRDDGPSGARRGLGVHCSLALYLYLYTSAPRTTWALICMNYDEDTRGYEKY
eukprot:COSAG02_NODE_3524_length_6615_cov_6.371393_12_plen_79_part_00